MSDAGEKVTHLGRTRRLADAVREVKNAYADRDDVVVELREAERMRLELLLQELEPVFADVPADDQQFDFAISSGLQPRLWIDATAHVAMGRDKRVYRFVKDTRLGRVVLSETSDIKAVAEQVTRYVAERIVERQRLLEGDLSPFVLAQIAGGTRLERFRAKADTIDWVTLLIGLGWVLLGATAGIAALVAWFWDRLAAGG